MPILERQYFRYEPNATLKDSESFKFKKKKDVLGRKSPALNKILNIKT